ncbi:MAG: hypothetical protein IKP73_03810 [Bacteroidales bacterium]|nr:hypothetical protein [Bacteroidales bacterium]
MQIKKSAIGNASEAFIEVRYNDNVNIISSNDNSKGKTIVVQSLLYALGNEPSFPSDFKYQNYYHYVEFDCDGDSYIICRKQDTFVVNKNWNPLPIMNINGLKSLFAKEVFHLPSIFKDGMVQIVNPVLFLQIFAIKQDSPNIASIEGGYSKDDFENMIYNALGVRILEDMEREKSNYENNLEKCKTVKKDYEKIFKVKGENPTFNFVKEASELEEFDEKYKQLNVYCNELEKIEIAKDEAFVELRSLSKLKNELVALNKNTQYGEFRCSKCNSTKIVYTFSKMNYSFDVSTPEMRKNILTSIEESIKICQERYDGINESLKTIKGKIHRLIEYKQLSIEFILLYKKELLENKGVEQKIRDVNFKIEELKNGIKNLTEMIENGKRECDLINDKINKYFRELLSQYELPDNIEFFPSKSKSPVGSDKMFVKIIKLWTLRRLLNHKCPIIIDSFRDGELSSNNEQHIVDYMLHLPNQVILTATMKTEELNKYKDNPQINRIDYSGHIKRKLLNGYSVEKFKDLLSNIGIGL